MRIERDWLWTMAVPRLREFCAQHCLTFLLVDLPSDLHHLRQSSSAAAADSINSLRPSELARCQVQSVGPDFVVGYMFSVHLC